MAAKNTEMLRLELTATRGMRPYRGITGASVQLNNGAQLFSLQARRKGANCLQGWVCLRLTTASDANALTVTLSCNQTALCTRTLLFNNAAPVDYCFPLYAALNAPVTQVTLTASTTQNATLAANGGELYLDGAGISYN